MKVALINSLLDEFKSYLEKSLGNKSRQAEEIIFKYENLKVYREHWDLGELDLRNMFDISFKSKISNRLWGGHYDSSKELMLTFIDHNKEYCRSMFRDLFNEGKDFSLRVNRFLFHCDELLNEVKGKGSKYFDHRQSYNLVSLYLAFEYPHKYCIIDYPEWSRFLKKVEVKTMPSENELERSMKLSKGLFTIMNKSKEIQDLYSSCLPQEISCEFNMFMLHDFYHFASE